MKQLWRAGAKILAVVLAWLIGAQSVLAAGQNVPLRSGALPAGVPTVAVEVPALQLPPSTLLFTDVRAPLFGATPFSTPFRFQLNSSVEGIVVPVKPGVPVPEAVRTLVEKKIEPARRAAAEAVRDIDNLPPDGASGAAKTQFDALTGEKNLDGADLVAEPPPASSPRTSQAAGETLAPASSAEAKPEPKAEVPPAKTPYTQVFKDAERNRSFWRYLVGYCCFMLGMEMYTVGLPFYMSSFVQNTLREHHDPRAANDEALKAVIWQTRSFTRIAHWTAQGLSYVAVPLFTRNSDGRLNWLPRTFWVRSGILLSIFALFYATGFMSIPTALCVLLALVAAQSFFQGIGCVLEEAGQRRLFGDPSVSSEERERANSLLNIASSIPAIVGPILASLCSQIKKMWGKSDVGGAVIYGVYGLFAGLAGLMYAMVKIFFEKRDASAVSLKNKSGLDPPGKVPLRGAMRDVWESLKKGVVMLVKDRFLRTMLILSLVASLFIDPLTFNVLPDYVDSLVHAHQGAIGIPGIGWLLKCLTSGAMGCFGLLMVGGSVGAMLCSLFMKPLSRLCAWLGFKTEESRIIPFYFLAALGVPLFWIMIGVHSIWPLVALYALQCLIGGFEIILTNGLTQKKLGTYSQTQTNRIMSAEYLLGIFAAIAVTLASARWLAHIPLHVSLLWAAVATTIYGIVQLVAPWLAFSKQERSNRITDPIENFLRPVTEPMGRLFHAIANSIGKSWTRPDTIIVAKHLLAFLAIVLGREALMCLMAYVFASPPFLAMNVLCLILQGFLVWRAYSQLKKRRTVTKS